MVDGLGIGDIGSAVIKDRQQLSQDGIVVVAYTIERKQERLLQDLKLQQEVLFI